MSLLKRLVFLGFTWGVLGLCSLSAQNRLERISITERSDGVGYVVRYHLSEMVDSYDLIQPETNRIQMQLFSAGLNTDAVQMPELNNEITGIELVPIEGGIGVDITTGTGVYFQAETYPDQNLRHLLLSLEYVTGTEAQELASESESYAWSVSEEQMMEDDTAPEMAEEESSEETESELQPAVQREPININLGFAGGIGFANKIGGGYSSDSRRGFVMGITASIDLPFVLRNSINTGIETGLFYTQKGFKNPTTQKYNAQTVVLDYIELPILARLEYDYTEIIKPHAVGGIYTAFRTAAEIVRDDGDRGSINGVTNTVDFGLVAGIGSDFVVEKAIVSLQIRYGVGIPRMFDKSFSGGERPGYLSLLMGFKF